MIDRSNRIKNKRFLPIYFFFYEFSIYYYYNNQIF